MSIECRECERDARSGHHPDCSIGLKYDLKAERAAHQETQAKLDALYVCSLCGSPSEFSLEESVWRHKGEPFQEPYMAQQFCGKYGYPITAITVEGRQLAETQAIVRELQADKERLDWIIEHQMDITLEGSGALGIAPLADDGEPQWDQSFVVQKSLDLRVTLDFARAGSFPGRVKAKAMLPAALPEGK